MVDKRQQSRAGTTFARLALPLMAALLLGSAAGQAQAQPAPLQGSGEGTGPTGLGSGDGSGAALPATNGADRANRVDRIDVAELDIRVQIPDRRFYVGDLVELTVRTELRDSLNLTAVELVDAGHLHVRDTWIDVEDTASEGEQAVAVVTVVAYRAGRHFVEDIGLTFTHNDGFESYHLYRAHARDPNITLTPLLVDVGSLIGAELDPALRPERDDVPVRFRSYTLVWVGLVVLVLLVAGLLIWKIARNRPVVEVAAAPVVVRPAHEIAFEKLDHLAESGVIENADHMGFYVGLSETLRGYLGTRFSFQALDMTTAEILRRLARVRLPQSFDREDIAALLRGADMVKFAKTTPTAEEEHQALDRGYQLVRLTMPPATSQAPPTSTERDPTGETRTGPDSTAPKSTGDWKPGAVVHPSGPRDVAPTFENPEDRWRPPEQREALLEEQRQAAAEPSNDDESRVGQAVRQTSTKLVNEAPSMASAYASGNFAQPRSAAPKPATVRHLFGLTSDGVESTSDVGATSEVASAAEAGSRPDVNSTAALESNADLESTVRDDLKSDTDSPDDAGLTLDNLALLEDALSETDFEPDTASDGAAESLRSPYVPSLTAGSDIGPAHGEGPTETGLPSGPDPFLEATSAAAARASRSGSLPKWDVFDIGTEAETPFESPRSAAAGRRSQTPKRRLTPPPMVLDGSPLDPNRDRLIPVDLGGDEQLLPLDDDLQLIPIEGEVLIPIDEPLFEQDELLEEISQIPLIPLLPLPPLPRLPLIDEPGPIEQVFVPAGDPTAESRPKPSGASFGGAAGDGPTAGLNLPRADDWEPPVVDPATLRDDPVLPRVDVLAETKPGLPAHNRKELESVLNSGGGPLIDPTAVTEPSMRALSNPKARRALGPDTPDDEESA